MAKEATAKAKQQALKGMEDREIQDLQDKAVEYASVRDDRMGLSRREGELQSELLALMHKHKKKTYSYKGVEIEVIVEKEKAKVRVHDESDDEDNETDQG